MVHVTFVSLKFLLCARDYEKFTLGKIGEEKSSKLVLNHNEHNRGKTAILPEIDPHREAFAKWSHLGPIQRVSLFVNF